MSEVSPSGPDAAPPAPTVLEEYKYIGESLIRSIERRQRTNDVYAAINSLFLSGIGLLLVSSQFDSWRVLIEVAVIALFVLPLNLAWITSMSLSHRTIAIHTACLRDLERRFRFEGNLATKLDFTSMGRGRALAFYFLILYAAIAAAVAVVTYLVMHHVM